MDFKMKTPKGLVVLATFAVMLTAACTTQTRETVDAPVTVASPEQVAIETIEAVRGNLQEVRGVLTSASEVTTKGVSADLVAFGTDLDAVDVLLQAADDALFEGDFAGADSLAVSAAEAVGAVRGALAGSGASDSQ